MRDQRGMRCCPTSERTTCARDGVVDALRLALREGVALGVSALCRTVDLGSRHADPVLSYQLLRT
jgi:hypothetical protein